MSKQVTVQVLNGATGEVREVTATVKAASEQEAVNILFARARKDDFYYRFLGHRSVVNPENEGAVAVPYNAMTYWALEV